MWTSDLTLMMLEGVRDTLLMTLMSTLFGYLIGLPWGIVLAVTDKPGIRPNAVVYKILDVIANIMRSIPFLILLILVMPITRAIVGKTTGSAATIVPLTLAAAPSIRRCDHRHRHDTRLFRHGWRRGRRRPGRYRYALRLLPLRDIDHDCLGGAFGDTGTDISDAGNASVGKTG